ncbi:MAG: acyltransferase, partial [Bdellovibrionales bacterium]|nr:acyltransferase [Bdellovibrionales bacterium]
MRAAAILMVIGFHAFPSMITGGYLGVDVFFVISGFLISRITIREMQDGTFTFYGFYSRRIRRIFPALALVISVTLLMGWRILLPKEYLSLGRHGLAGTSLIPNFLLQKESGYFDITIAQKPLGHLWSIGVEEQFYVLWPFLLLLTRKLRISALASVLVITALSLLQSLSVGREFSRAGYFLPQYRAWEIGIGCLLGIMNKEKLQKISDRQSDILSIAGAALVLTPLCTEKSLNVPSSIYSMGILSATFGTAALLISGEKKATFVRLILSHPWIVALGKISYSLYLWHWPLIVYAKYLNGLQPLGAWRWAILALAVGLLALSLRFVETP